MTKNLYTAAVLIAAAIAVPACAQTKQEDHKAHHPQETGSATAVKPMEKAASGGMQGSMDEHCADMQKIMKIKDPKKRQKAMEDHKKKMHDEDGCPMMKDGMGGGMGMGKDMGNGPSAPTEMGGGMRQGMGK